MPSHVTTSTKTVLAAAGAAVGLLLGAVGPAQAATTTAATTGTATMTQASLLRFDQIQHAGQAVDDVVGGTRGDQLLGDAGRFDEGCLGEKTMRNITGAKDYPAPGEAKVYLDATWTSTLDKDVWLSESVAQGRSVAKTDHYVRLLLNEIRDVKSCEQDPAQGHSYGPAHRVTVGTATGRYFLDYESDGTTDGGGVAVVRDGDRVGFVDLMFGRGKPGLTLDKLTRAAAGNLR